MTIHKVCALLLGATMTLGAPVGAPMAKTFTVSSYAGSDGRLDVMALGDSLTRGQGDPAWRGYRIDLRTRLAGVGQVPNMVGPWADGDGDREHAGTSGARIDQLNVQVPQLMATYRPDVVLLMIGTNDVGQSYQLDTVTDRMVSLIGRVRTSRPTARVFVSTIPGWADPGRQTIADGVNTSIRAAVTAVADPKVTLVPNHIVGVEPEDRASDGVHLSPCGYAKVAFVWWLYMTNSDVRPPADTWPGGDWPWESVGGPCNP